MDPFPISLHIVYPHTSIIPYTRKFIIHYLNTSSSLLTVTSSGFNLICCNWLLLLWYIPLLFVVHLLNSRVLSLESGPSNVILFPFNAGVTDGVEENVSSSSESGSNSRISSFILWYDLDPFLSSKESDFSNFSAWFGVIVRKESLILSSSDLIQSWMEVETWRKGRRRGGSSPEAGE